MRFKITFHRTGKQRMLPIDYQYYLSAWIYKAIAQADPEFSSFLHAQGYTSGNKRFKLFCYSPLNFGKPILWKEKALFEIHSDELSAHVSFHLAEAAEKFIIGLFNNQQVFIGDRFNGIDLAVKHIERLAEPELTETMGYKAYSPVVVSYKEPNRQVYAQYLPPVANEYEKFLKENLVGKINSLPDPPPLPDDFEFRFKLLGVPKSKLVTVKPYTPEQSKIRGFTFGFTLTCPIEIHQLILSTGIGEKNSMGFGWVTSTSSVTD